MPLTDAQCRKARAAEASYKLSDAGGLYLFVTPAGSKSWRLKYRFAGKEKRLTFGLYPEVGLVEARDKRDAARRLLRDNVDPGVERKKARALTAAQSVHTFERVARDWHASQLERWSGPHAETVIESLERDLFPAIGSLPINEIDTPLVLATLRKVEARGAVETAHRLRQRMSATFVHAISQGIGSADPAAIVTKALKKMPRAQKQPAILDLAELRKLLATIDTCSAEPTTKLASRLIALTAVRPMVVRGALWREFEGIDWTDERAGPDLPVWRIPAARMKLDVDKKAEEAMEHVVPLPFQAVDVLRAVRRLTGRWELVFPSARHSRKPMAENTMAYVYQRCGYQGRHVPHGWRAAFSTIMNERAERDGRTGDRAVIDLMLAHVPKGMSGSEHAYNRAAYMPRRRELGQSWADSIMVDALPAGGLIENA